MIKAVAAITSETRGVVAVNARRRLVIAAEVVVASSQVAAGPLVSFQVIILARTTVAANHVAAGLIDSACVANVGTAHLTRSVTSFVLSMHKLMVTPLQGVRSVGAMNAVLASSTLFRA
jgi:hypothetical protein